MSLGTLKDPCDAIGLRQKGCVHHRETEANAEPLDDAGDHVRSQEDGNRHEVAEMNAGEHDEAEFFAAGFHNGRSPLTIEENHHGQRQEIADDREKNGNESLYG